MLEQRKYIKEYTNVIEFPAQKINNTNRSNKSVITFMGKKYWMDNKKIEVYKAIGCVLGVMGIAAEFMLLYIYLWHMSF